METPRKFIRGVSTNKTIICFIAMQTYKEFLYFVAKPTLSTGLKMHAKDLVTQPATCRNSCFQNQTSIVNPKCSSSQICNASFDRKWFRCFVATFSAVTTTLYGKQLHEICILVCAQINSIFKL